MTDRALKEHTGAMIAFMLEPSDSKALLSAVPRKLAVDDDGLHLTLMYLGDTVMYGDGFQDLIGAALEIFAAENGPITGHVGGVGRFDDIDPEGTSALYASFDAAELPAFRQRLVEHLAQLGIVSPSEHGFTPHITLAYLPAGAQAVTPDVPALKLTFRAVTLAWGDTHFDYPLDLSGEPSFQVTKGVDGRLHWVLLSSNSFQDREGEIVSQKALEADVARADKEGDYGTLDWWHLDGYPDKNSGEPTPKVTLGHCTGNAMHGRMLVEWGDFVSDAVGQAVKAVAGDLAVSIAFLHPESEPDAAGVYHHIRRYSRALLPRRFASNPLTAAPIIVQEEKHMVKEKIAALRAVMGGDDDLVNQVLALASAKEQAALEAGVRHKETAQKATITISDDDKPTPGDGRGQAEDEKPKDEAPQNESPAAEDKPADQAPPPAEATEGEKPAGEQPAEGEQAPPAGGAPPAEGAPAAPSTIGHYTEQQLAEYVSKCIDAKLEAMQGQQQQQQAAKEARDAELLQTVKEQGDQLAHLLKAVEAAGAGATAALEGVAELKGEAPRSRKGFRASQQGDEVGEEDAAAAQKEMAGPQADPLAKHWGAVLGAFQGNGHVRTN